MFKYPYSLTAQKIVALFFLHLFFGYNLMAQESAEKAREQPRGPNAPASAGDVLVIDEGTLEMLVLTNNFDYKKAKINYSQSARSLQGVWNDFFPTITGTGQIQYNMNNALVNSGNQSSDSKTSLALAAQINLTAWVVFSIMKTTADYNVGKITFESARKKILDTSKKTFHSLILSKKLLELQESTVRLAQVNYGQAVSRYNSGLIERGDMISTQVELENQRNQLQTQKTTYEKDMLAFKLVVGVPLEQPVNLIGEITIDPRPLDGTYLVKNYVDSSPDVRLAQATVWSNRWQTYYQHLNIVSPFAQLGYNIGNPYSASLPNATGWGDGLSATIGVKIQFDSLFPWSKNGLSLWQLRDSLTLSKEEAAKNRVQAHIDITNAVNSVNNTQNNIRSLRLAYTLSEENLSLAITGYQRGVKDFVEVQQATQSRSTALSNYLKAQQDYYSAMLDLSYLTNLDVTEILEVAAITPGSK